MFKNVEYFNFEHDPELRRLIQERAMPVLEDELRSSADRISLIWGLRPTTPQGEPVLELELTDDWAGRELQYFTPSHFAPGLYPERLFRWRIRDMHGKLLDDFLRKQTERIKRELAAAAGG